ncbi:MAG: Ig-like domain-containing protein, partial [Pseudonocardiaceae bacterium]
GDGSGGFTGPTNFPAGAQPRSVVVGELNGDARPDLAVANANSGNVSVLLNASNRPPVAAGDAYTTAEDTPLTVTAPGVLGNDTDPDGDTLTAVVVSPPGHGSLTVNTNGSFTYTPAPNYSGPDSFTYKASDATATSNTATVALTVTPVNDTPVAVNDSYTIAEDTPLTVTVPGVLGNDTDPDGGHSDRRGGQPPGPR